MTIAMRMDQATRPIRACAISAATADKFARLRNHAKRAIARSVTSAVRIVIRDFSDLTQYIRLLARAVRYCCVRLRAVHRPGKMRVSPRPSEGLPLPFAAPVIQTRLNGAAPHRQGKVRDIYELGDRLVLVATDRISAFDYVLGSGIPDKGKVLTQLSAFLFDRTHDIVPNHLIATDVAQFPPGLREDADLLAGRSMLVRKTNPIPIECVARGYLSGSGWQDYQATGAVCGVPLPGGLRESDRLPAPVFTPATKATSGHDVDVSEAEAGRIVARNLVATLRALSS